MAIGVSVDQLGLVSTTISIISENLKLIAPNVHDFSLIMRPKYLNTISIIRFEFNRMIDNPVLWWADQHAELQNDLLERCLKNHYKKAKNHGRVQLELVSTAIEECG